MELPLLQPRTLWRIEGFGHQSYPAGRVYHFDNQTRQPAEQVVLQLTLTGQVAFTAQSQPPIWAGPGDLLLFRYGEATTYGSPHPRTEPYSCRWVNLQGAGLIEHLHLLRSRYGAVLHLGLDHPLAERIIHLQGMAQPSARVSASAIARALHLYVLDLLELAQQRQMAELPPVQQAIERMLAQPQRNWSLKTLADEAGCSREHLTRCFHERVGTPPAAWMRAQKTQRAVALLRQTSLPLKAIAAQAGFGTVHSLIRQVQLHTGRNPSAWRQG